MQVAKLLSRTHVDFQPVGIAGEEERRKSYSNEIAGIALREMGCNFIQDLFTQATFFYLFSYSLF